MIKKIAHRGKYNTTIKENTYLSIKQALNDPQYIGVEFDIRLTKDNQLVVIHDATITRTSNGTGLVQNMTLKELKKYNYGSQNLPQTIPTLKQILDIDSNKIFLIELKCNHNEKNIVNKLLELLVNYPTKNIWLCSFSQKALKLLKKKNYSPLGLIMMTSFSKRFKYNLAIIYKYGFTNHKITKLLKKQKTILLWTIQGQEELNNMIKMTNNDNIIYIYNEKN